MVTNIEKENNPETLPRVQGDTPKSTSPRVKKVQKNTTTEIPPRVKIIEKLTMTRHDNQAIFQLQPTLPYLIPYETEEIYDKRYPLRSRIASTVFNKYTGEEEGYTALDKVTQKDVCILTYVYGIGMLVQGIRDFKGTITIKFISYQEVTLHKKVTYGKKEVSIRTTKAKNYIFKLKVGGDRLELNG